MIQAILNELERVSKSLSCLATKQDLLEMEKRIMSALDDKIAALTTEVANETTVEKSALVLIQGISAQVAAAVAAATAAGATPTQLAAMTTLQTTLAANDAELSAAVAANTPAAAVS